jgi:hypothetical protein
MIIGLVGKKGSGKSTAAKIAKEEYGFKILSFAKPLKEMLSVAFNQPMHYFTDPVLKEVVELPIEPSVEFIKKLTDYAYHNLIPVSSQLEVNMILELENFPKRVTPRALMQFVGTNLFRNCVSDNYWIHVMDMEMDANSHYSNRFIFDDVRFPQEVQFVKDKGGLIMKLIRPMPLDTPVDNHASETAIDAIEADFMIRNDDLLFFKEAVRFSLTEAYHESKGTYPSL